MSRTAGPHLRRRRGSCRPARPCQRARLGRRRGDVDRRGRGRSSGVIPSAGGYSGRLGHEAAAQATRTAPLPARSTLRSSSSLPGWRIGAPGRRADAVAHRDLDWPLRMTEISRAPSGSSSFSTRLPAGRVRRDLHLDDLEVLRAQLEQVHELVLGNLVLDQRPWMFEVAQIVGAMPSRSKCAWLRG